MARNLPTLWSSLDRLRDDFDNTVERLFRGRGANGEVMPWGMAGPLADMEETDDEIIVRAEMPGLQKDDFNVELQNNRLTIRGEKKATEEKKEKNYHYSEIMYGSFSRSFTLPVEVASDKVDAKYENGTLTIRMPKSEKARTKKVKVDVS